VRAEAGVNKHSLAELEGRRVLREYDCVTDPMTSDKPNRVSHVAYGYATHVVILGNDGKVQKVVAAHDVGKAINPNGVEGQIEGGVVMGLGYRADRGVSVRNGAPAVTLRHSWADARCAGSGDCVPSIEKNSPTLAYGAKGVGEIVMLTTAPAVASHTSIATESSATAFRSKTLLTAVERARQAEHHGASSYDDTERSQQLIAL
jgi:CO/xanthine dehydrogenase Mo-binding subunit